MNTTTGSLHSDQESITHWSALRYQHVIKLRETALNFARDIWADYLFVSTIHKTYSKTLK